MIGSVREVRSIPSVAGCAVLSDGRLALCLDVSRRSAWEIQGDVANGTFANTTLRSIGIATDSNISATSDDRWLAWVSKGSLRVRDAIGDTTELSSDVWMTNPYLSPDGSAVAVKAPSESVYRILSLHT